MKRSHPRSKQVLERFNFDGFELAERGTLIKVRKYAFTQASALDAEFKDMLHEIEEGLTSNLIQAVFESEVCSCHQPT